MQISRKIIIIFLFLYQRFVFCADCLVDQQNILKVSSTGCNLVPSATLIEVDKIILDGTLTISQLTHLKYKSIEVGAEAGFNIRSRYDKILIESIDERECDIQKQSKIKFKAQSNSANEWFDIESISNNQELIITNRIPFMILPGVKVLITSKYGTEYSYVQSVQEQKIFLTSKLDYKHEKFYGNGFSDELPIFYPQLLLLDENRINFKKTCFNFVLPHDEYYEPSNGIIFEDPKGLKFSYSQPNGYTKLQNLIIIDNSFQQRQDFYFDISIEQLVFINIKQSIYINYEYGGQNFSFVKSQITSYLSFNYLNEFKIYNSECSFEGSKGMVINSKILTTAAKNNEIVIEHSNLINSSIVSNSESIKIRYCYISEQSFDFTTFSFLKNLEFSQIIFNGMGLNYFTKLRKVNSGEQLIVKLYDSVLLNFENPSHPLIYSDYPLGNTINQILKRSDVRYDVQFANEYIQNQQSEKLKLIDLPYLLFLYTIPELGSEYWSLFLDFYSDFNYLRYGKLIQMNSVAVIQFDLLEQNSNYLLEIQHALRKKQFNFQEDFYICTQILHRVYINLKPNISQSQNKITLKIITDYLYQQTVLPLLIYLDSKNPIKSIKANSAENIIFNRNTDGSIVIKKINNENNKTEIIIEIEICGSGMFLDGDKCSTSCGIGIINLNRICQSAQQTIDYYYLDGNVKQYFPCPFNCQKCDKQKCLQCSTIHSTYILYNCGAITQSNYYDYGSNSLKKCQDDNCLLCSQSFCLQCKDGFVRNQNQSGCISISSITSTYVYEGLRGCDSRCESCVHTFFCTKCKSGFTLVLGMCNQICPEGYIFQQDKCLAIKEIQKAITDPESYYYKCQPILNDCKNVFALFDGKNYYNCFDSSASSCITPYSGGCQVNEKLVSGICVPQCEIKSFFDEKLKICQKCQDSCLSCDNQSTCTSCKAEYHLQDNQCMKCQSGTFSLDKSNKCELCSEKCKECSGTSTQCTKCHDGFYLKDSQCISCNKNCLKCNESSCLSCENGFIHVINQQDCKQCQNGYFSVKGDTTCSKCNEGCSNCLNLNTCTSCQDGYQLNKNQCLKCEIGTFSEINSSGCQKCSVDCKECQGSQNNCTSCNEGYYLKNSKCIPCGKNCEKCNENMCLQCSMSFYYEKNGSADCKRCDLTCKECSYSQSNCTECLTDQYKLENSNCVLKYEQQQQQHQEQQLQYSENSSKEEGTYTSEELAGVGVGSLAAGGFIKRSQPSSKVQPDFMKQQIQKTTQQTEQELNILSIIQ